MADCTETDTFTNIIKFFTDPIGTVVRILAEKMLKAAVDLLRQVTDAVPTLTGAGQVSSKSISTQVEWLVMYVAVGSLIYASIRMALERRGDAGTTWVKGMIRLILVGGAGSVIFSRAATVSDDYTHFLFTSAIRYNLENTVCDGQTPANLLLLIIAFLLLIAAIVQLILLYIRLGLLIVLLGTLPLAAVASMTEWGGTWWRKHMGWLIAWLLYKPTVALVIFAGTEIVSIKDKSHPDMATKLAGIGVLLLSAVALPALLKLIVPATAALGGGNSGKATTAAAGAIATGALNVAATGAKAAQQGAMIGATRGASGARGAGGGGGPQGGGGRSGGGGSSGGSGTAGALGKVGAAGAAGVAAAGVAAAFGAGKAVVSGAMHGSIDGQDGDHAAPGRGGR